MNVQQMQQFKQLRHDVAELKSDMDRLFTQLSQVQEEVKKLKPKRGRPRKEAA